MPLISRELTNHQRPRQTAQPTRRCGTTTNWALPHSTATNWALQHSTATTTTNHVGFGVLEVHCPRQVPQRHHKPPSACPTTLPVTLTQPPPQNTHASPQSYARTAGPREQDMQLRRMQPLELSSVAITTKLSDYHAGLSKFKVLIQNASCGQPKSKP